MAQVKDSQKKEKVEETQKQKCEADRGLCGDRGCLLLSAEHSRGHSNVKYATEKGLFWVKRTEERRRKVEIFM